ncbi:MAG: DMT family transporter [Pseudomonadales bacterium]|nr:DMT family transporter [Pseudomonadales bacterium]
MASNQYVKADLLLLLVTALAALGWIFSQQALVGMPPLLFIGSRFLLASTVLCLFGWNQWAALSVKQFQISAWVGILFAVAMMLWITGLHHATHVGEGAFIASLGTVLVPIVALLVYRQPQPRTMWLALPIAILGFATLALGREGSNMSFQPELGQLYFLASAVVFALQVNANSRAVQQVPVVLLTAVQLVFVGILATAASYFTEQWPTGISFGIAGWLLASAFISSSFRFLIQTYAFGLAPVSHGAMILTLEPVWVALLAMLWLDESMTGLQLLGCGLIFSALMVNRWQWLMMLFRKAASR